MQWDEHCKFAFMEKSIAPLTTFEPSLIPATTRFLNKALDYDFFTENLLKDKTLDDPDYDADLCLLLQENEQPQAFAMGVVRRNIRGEDIAYIKLLAVAPPRRRQGLASHLYHQLEQAFREQGADKVRVYDAPFNYFMPGIDPRYTEAIAFFERLGFKRFADTSNMNVDLMARDWGTKREEDALKKANIYIRRCHADDEKVLMAFVDKWFDLWRPEVERMLLNKPCSVHLAFEEDEMIAFSGHSGNNAGMPWFGPMGTHPEKRGRGVGGILLKRCLRDLKQEGYSRAIIPWVGPVSFYQYHAAARVDRIFWRYEKHL